MTRPGSTGVKERYMYPGNGGAASVDPPVRFRVEAQEHIDAPLDSGAVYRIPVAFNPNLSQYGGDYMLGRISRSQERRIKIQVTPA